MKFRMMTYFDPLEPSGGQKLEFFYKSKMDDGRYWTKRLSRGQHRYSANAIGVRNMGVHALAPIEPSVCGGDAPVVKLF